VAPPAAQTLAQNRRNSGSAKKWVALSGGAVLLCAILAFAVFYIHRATVDASIVRELNEHLKNDSGIAPSQITFTSSGRNVTLTGTVYSQTAKYEAAEFAHHHLGATIKSITNNIQVLPPYVVPEEEMPEISEKIGLYKPGGNLSWVRESGDEFQFLPDQSKLQKVTFVKVQPPGTGWVEHIKSIERYGRSWDDYAVIKVNITWDGGDGLIYREFTLSRDRKSLSDCIQHERDSSAKSCPDAFNAK